MSRRRITVIDRGDIVVVRGWQVQPILADGSFKAVFSASAGGWMLDVRHLPDVVALLESRNFPVMVVDETKPLGGGAA